MRAECGTFLCSHVPACVSRAAPWQQVSSRRKSGGRRSAEALPHTCAVFVTLGALASRQVDPPRGTTMRRRSSLHSPSLVCSSLTCNDPKPHLCGRGIKRHGAHRQTEDTCSHTWKLRCLNPPPSPHTSHCFLA